MTERKTNKSQAATQSPKELPADRDAERTLLGALMVDNQYIAKVRAIVGALDFSEWKHGEIWHAMVELDDEHIPIDIVTVADKLTELGRLADIGGRAYLIECQEDNYSAANSEHYAEIVKSKSQLRHIIEVTSRANIEAYGHKNPIELVANTVSALKELGRDHRVVVQNISDYAEMAVKPPRGVVTGFAEIDERIVCLDYGSLVTVCGATGMGKTSWSTDIHRNNFRLGVDGILIDGEMTIEQRVHRIAAAETRIPISTIRQGNLNVAQRALCEQAVASMALRFIYMPRLELTSVIGIIATYSTEGIKLFTIDNVQKMRDSSRRYDTRTQEIGAITNELKEAAGKYDCCVVIISHMSRVKDNRKPSISDLRDSGTIEQDSDTVILVHRTDSVETSIDFLKGRQLGRAEFRMEFYPTLATFKPGGVTQSEMDI